MSPKDMREKRDAMPQTLTVGTRSGLEGSQGPMTMGRSYFHPSASSLEWGEGVTFNCGHLRSGGAFLLRLGTHRDFPHYENHTPLPLRRQYISKQSGDAKHDTASSCSHSPAHRLAALPYYGLSAPLERLCADAIRKDKLILPPPVTAE